MTDINHNILIRSPSNWHGHKIPAERIGSDCMAMRCHNLDMGKLNTNTHRRARSGTGRQTKFILDKPKSAYGGVALFPQITEGPNSGAMNLPK